MNNDPHQNTNSSNNASSNPAAANFQPNAPGAQPLNPPTNTENVLTTAQQVSSIDENNNQTQGNDKITTLVLEWLTYAFWWWTVLGLSLLVGITISYFVANAETYSFTPYGIAVVLVLLPISVVCDVFYSKKESNQKKGAELAVAAIHAVLFALIAVGAVITAVFQIISMLLNSGAENYSTVGLITSVLVAFFYVLTLLRTIQPKALSSFKRIYKFIMIGLVTIAVIAGIMGPVVNEGKTKNDRLLETSLTDIVSALNSYSSKNNKLPAALSDLSVTGDAKIAIEKNLIEYKPVTSTTQYNTNTNTNPTSKTSYNYYSTRANYDYDLCVTYVKEKTSRYDAYGDDSTDTITKRTTYISAYTHPKGRVCYEMTTN